VRINDCEKVKKEKEGSKGRRNRERSNKVKRIIKSTERKMKRKKISIAL
jgi:hypothetical protein